MNRPESEVIQNAMVLAWFILSMISAWCKAGTSKYSNVKPEKHVPASLQIRIKVGNFDFVRWEHLASSGSTLTGGKPNDFVRMAEPYST